MLLNQNIRQSLVSYSDDKWLSSSVIAASAKNGGV
jgi:hypothetical protein